MKQLTLKQSLNTFNWLFITTFLVLALYSALGQQVFPYIGQYKTDIELYLNDKLNSDIDIRTLSGDMNIFTPSIHMEGITMSAVENQALPGLSIAAVDAILDPQASLLNLTPVFKSVRISGLSIHIAQATSGNQKIASDNSAVIQRFIESLLLQKNLELNNVTVEFSKGNNTERFHLNHLSMTGDGFHRLMTGDITFGIDKEVKAGIRLYSEGNPYELDDFYARGVVNLPKIAVDYWVEKIADVSVFDEFEASAQLGVEFKDGLLNYAKLNLATTEVSIPKMEPFKNISTELWLKQDNVDTWSIWLEQGDFTYNAKKWSLQDIGLKLSQSENGSRWHSFVKNADIEYSYNLIKNLGLLPESIDKIYQDISPSGELNNFNIVIQTPATTNPAQSQVTEAAFTLAGELSGVSTQALDSIPGVHNINGVIAATKNSGRVQFEGSDMALDFPNLYHNPFEIIKGKGQVDWEVGEQGFRILGNGLDVQLPGVSSLKGGFDLIVPQSDTGKTGIVELNLSTTNTDILAHPSLVPKVTPKTLNDWLVSALQGGEIDNGQFYFYDAVGNDSSDPVMELYLDAKHSELAYLEGWPSIKNINGQVFVKNNDVYGIFNSATTLGGALNNAQIAFKNGREPYLWVTTNAEGSGSSMFSYFKTTPLKDLVNNIFNEWELSGTQKTSLGLKIPLEGELSLLKADVNADLTQASLNLNDIGISVDNINGSIRYSTDTGLTSPKLTGNLWDEKMTSRITSSIHGRDMKSDIQFEGMMNASKLQDWVKLSLLEPVSGRSHTEGHMIIDTRESEFSGLTFASQLKGIALNLPGKFEKSADEELPLKGSLELKDGQILKLSYDNKVNLAMGLNQGKLISGQIFIGQTEAYLPSEAGVVVDGHLKYFNLNDWIDTWNLIQSSKYAGSFETSENKTAPTSNPIRLLNVSTDMFQYNDFRFEQASAVINQNEGVWQFNIDAPVAKGLITLDENKPIDVDLEYIHWPMADSSHTAAGVSSDPLKDVDPKVLPLMTFEVDEIFLGATNVGKWKLNIQPIQGGAKFSKVDGVIKKLNVKGDAQWIKVDAIEKEGSVKQTTNISALLTSNDIAGIQKAWRRKPVVEAEYGKINTELSWTGSPMAPVMSTVNGKLDLNLKDGRFIEAGDASSLSAFGLLNFSAIGRRLRLDFSDVYESGFHFDYVKGRTKLDKGIIQVVDTLEIEGPSAKFETSGTVDLNTKLLKQELSATFPVTGSLPLMAIIAGFAPPVAASLFVGERLVGDEIEKFTSATYQLTGTWDEPKLDLMKRFDNDIEGKQSKSFWYRMKDFFGVGEE